MLRDFSSFSVGSDSTRSRIAVHGILPISVRMPPKPELQIPTGCEERKAGNLYSSFDVYKALTGYLEEAVPKAGFELSQLISNIRILLMTTACSGALYAHFGCKFPKDQLWIALFAVLYFIQSGTVVLIDYFIVKSSCLVFIDKQTSERVFLDVDRPYTDNTVTIRLRTKGAAVSSTQSMGKYFNSDGTVEQKATFTEFLNLYRQLKEQTPSKAAKQE